MVFRDSGTIIGRRKLLRAGLCVGFGGASAILLSRAGFAAPAGFEQWRDGFRAKALAKGISDTTYTRVMAPSSRI